MFFRTLSIVILSTLGLNLFLIIAYRILLILVLKTRWIVETLRTLQILIKWILLNKLTVFVILMLLEFLFFIALINWLLTWVLAEKVMLIWIIIVVYLTILINSVLFKNSLLLLNTEWIKIEFWNVVLSIIIFSLCDSTACLRNAVLISVNLWFFFKNSTLPSAL